MKDAKYYWLAVLFFIVAFLVPLSPRPMVTPDEFRYAQIPREMIETGNWSAPHMLSLRYFEKPVLGYWMTAASFKIFGENKFALRLPMALMTALTAFFIALLVQQTLGNERIGALAVMLFLSSGLVYGVGTFAVLDLPVTALITGVSCAAFQALREPCYNRRKVLLLILCGVFAGLAFMTKGFLAFVVPGLTVLGFICWERRWKELYKMPWIPLISMLIVVLPWAVRVHQLEPDFWHYFIVEEHWNRFAGGENSEHASPFWYFIPVLLGGVFPGALLWLPEIFTLGRKKIGELMDTSLCRFCICAVVLPFLFFSASSGKLATYILPCFPFLAILAAVLTAAYFRTGGPYKVYHFVMDLWGGVCILGGIGLLSLRFVEPAWLKLDAADTDTFELLSKNAHWGAIVIILAGIALLVIRKSWRPRMICFFAGLAFSICAVLWSTPEGLLMDKTPEKSLNALFANRELDVKNAKIITLQSYMHAVAWCSGRKDLLLLGNPGEMDYGNEAAAKNGEPGNLLSAQKFISLVNSSDRPEILLVFRAQEKRVEPRYHFTGGKRFQDDHMVVLQLKKGAKSAAKVK
ncbi:MAG: phospholipid carrier-dependent glycosyltransferase [Lentisphaeria bacterium]|nr:phospholipid carrier-dependent glycosyltransferase [Lentisphaeria bacterium]